MNIVIFTVVYIIIVLGELYLTKQYIKNAEENKEVFLKPEEQKTINNEICNELKKRLEKLKTMSYDEWLEYNQNNRFKFKDEELGINIFEKLKNSNRFIVRTTKLIEYLDMEIDTEYDIVQQQSEFYKDGLKSITALDTFNSNEFSDGCSRYSYLWINPSKENSPIIKKTINKRFQKIENGMTITGVICIGYTSFELENNSHYYFNVITNYFLVILYIFIYIVSVVTYYITNGNLYESFILFFILNLYSTSSLISKDFINTSKYEEKLVGNLNSSILGISFLVAANIFVIQSLKNDKIYKSLYNETAFLFCCSLIALMIAMFKITDFKNTIDVKTHRVQNQVFFNLSIILNIFIFLNYFIYISDEKIVSVIPNALKNIVSFLKKKFKGKKV